MKQHAALKPLDRLVDLREREVERLSATVAEQQALRARYLGNIERMQQLCADSGASGAPGAFVPALSVNCGHYKQSLLALAQSHRNDLAAHEAQMARVQQALQQAARGHESLSQVSAKRREALDRARAGREQKQQDDIATQVWSRSKW